ncbi:hypothetical protein E4U21_007929 [Claviceps maximensis]|nr:hypothetical protein E4U21_007929 [Claviceps maximensis]
MTPEEKITVEYRGRVAILTVSSEEKLGALNHDEYYALGAAMNEIAQHDEVVTTVVTGKGRFFSAGADITSIKKSFAAPQENHKYWLQTFASLQLHVTHAFAHHPKILVAALNGPVLGLSAALIGWADFIYCTPQTFVLTPFSSLGLVAEGGASRGLARRLGAARANEALIMGKKLGADDLKACGFVNEIFDVGRHGGADQDDKSMFRERVLREVDDRLGEHLNGESVLGIKKLLRRPDRHLDDEQGIHEILAGLDRFLTGIPQEEFRKLASGEKRHKL